MTEHLHKELVDDFQAISIILALATVFFGTQYAAILSARGRTQPIAGDEAIRLYRQDLSSTIVLKALPLFVVTALSFYLLLPKSWLIVTSSRIQLFDFDFIATAWVFTSALLLAACLWAGTQLTYLILKWRNG